MKHWKDLLQDVQERMLVDLAVSYFALKTLYKPHFGEIPRNLEKSGLFSIHTNTSL